MAKRILRLPKVIDATGFGRSKIYELVRQNAFPKPVALGAHSVGWVEDEVEAWIAERIAARDGATSGA